MHIKRHDTIMKNYVTSMALLLVIIPTMAAETISINGTDYEMQTLIQRDLGPGIQYTRLRLPSYPLNVNMLIMDTDNPYNAVETTQSQDKLGTTEGLASAATRHSSTNHKVLAGANANFWCVSGQPPYSGIITGHTYGANMTNGCLITETNMGSDAWAGGWTKTGSVGIDSDNKLWAAHMSFTGTLTSSAIGTLEFTQVNKVVRDGEISLYNKYFGVSKQFKSVDYSDASGTATYTYVDGTATEVYLTLAEGESWRCGRDIKFTVSAVKQNAGRGTLGSYDACLVGRGDTNVAKLNQLQVGDEVRIYYAFTIGNVGTSPKFEQMISGNAMVMVNGVQTTDNTTDSYCSQVYSRTGYGCSADGKKLYIMVIDKSTDPTYGRSAGCGTSVMCTIAKHFGCSDMCNFDAGGSAEMLVGGKIINKTTESSPRSVANGWLLYSTAPTDNTVARIAFEDPTIDVPFGVTYTPKMLGYNQYGDLVSEDVTDFTLECDAAAGTCQGTSYTANGKLGTHTLTAIYNGNAVSKEVTVSESPFSIRINPILIDGSREYKMEAEATVNNTNYPFDASVISWSSSDQTVAAVDANAVLRGYKEGSTTITGNMGNYSAQTTVNVEIAPTPEIAAKLSDGGWAIRSGFLNASISGDDIAITYNSSRETTVTLTKTVTVYSLPDKLTITFTSGIPVSSFELDLRSPQHTESNIVTITPTTGDAFAVNEATTVEIPLSSIGNPTDLIMYPITLYSVKITFKVDATYNGKQTFTLDGITAHYNNSSSGIESVVTNANSATSDISIYPNPIKAGELLTITANAEINSVAVTSMSGAEVFHLRRAGDINATIDTSAFATGAYLVKVDTAIGTAIAKLIVE
jgi:hypothetical protein